MATVTISVKRTKKKKIPNYISGPRSVKVGIIKGKADEDNINKAIWNEFGTKGGASGGGWGGPVPERPFLRNAMKNKKAEYKDALRKGAVSVVRGDYTMGVLFDKLGNKAVQDIKAEITALSDPENSPTTVKLKGSSNPLINTGEMRNAVSYEVEK